ncbi:hypothetical protein B4Q13_24815 [Lacticaseibacillus rhamnosus]
MRAVSEPIPVRSVFSAMKVREENCNMVLLSAVALVSDMVAFAASRWDRPQAAAVALAAGRIIFAVDADTNRGSGGRHGRTPFLRG